MMDKKILFSIIFFILIIGFFGLFIAIHSGITGKGFHGQTLIVSESTNFFIRYSLQLMFVFGSLGCLLLPILFLKGYIGPDKAIVDKNKRAKGEFIIGSCLICAISFALLGSAFNGGITAVGKIAGVVFISYYFYLTFKFINSFK